MAKARSGYLARRETLRKPPKPAAQHEHFGLIVASYEGADVVPAPGGLSAFTDSGLVEIPSHSGRACSAGRQSWTNWRGAIAGTAPLHDGRWGRATMAVCLAAIESSDRQAVVRIPE